MTIDRPIMRYHGGKFRIAPWIIGRFPPHQRYVELFGGAASILLQKPRSCSEVYNDLDGDIVNVFRVLQDPVSRDRLIELCALTPYSRAEFDRAHEETADPVDAARRTIFRAQAGYGSASATAKVRSGFRHDSERSKTAAHVWAEYPSFIAAFAERFTGVIIEQRLAIELIPLRDSDQTLFYADPPYLHSTRCRTVGSGGGYRHEMTDEQHVQLLQTLLSCEGAVVISGYQSDLYTDMLSGWRLHSRRVGISGNSGGSTRTECLWVSPNVPEPQLELVV